MTLWILKKINCLCTTGCIWKAVRGLSACDWVTWSNKTNWKYVTETSNGLSDNLFYFFKCVISPFSRYHLHFSYLFFLYFCDWIRICLFYKTEHVSIQQKILISTERAFCLLWQPPKFRWMFCCVFVLIFLLRPDKIKIINNSSWQETLSLSYIFFVA